MQFKLGQNFSIKVTYLIWSKSSNDKFQLSDDNCKLISQPVLVTEKVICYKTDISAKRSYDNEPLVKDKRKLSFEDESFEILQNDRFCAML